jgi:hypothetical protein
VHVRADAGQPFADGFERSDTNSYSSAARTGTVLETEEDLKMILAGIAISIVVGLELYPLWKETTDE